MVVRENITNAALSVSSWVPIALVCACIIVWVSLAYLRPRDSPGMAGILARFGWQPTGTPLVITIRRGELPKGIFSVRVLVGREEFTTSHSEFGEFEQAFWLNVPQHITEAKISLVESHGQKSITTATEIIEVCDLLRAMGSPITVEFVKQTARVNHGVLLGTLSITARVPANEKTSLLAGIDDDSRQLKAAIVTAPKQASPEKVFEGLIEGPITCLGNSVIYCRVETDSKSGRKCWCFYDTVPDSKATASKVSRASKGSDTSDTASTVSTASNTPDAHFRIPFSAISSVKHSSCQAFEVIFRHGGKDEKLFLQVAKDARVWAESVKALRGLSNKDESSKREKAWISFDKSKREAEWEAHETKQKLAQNV